METINWIWIKNLVQNYSGNIINKYENMRDPMRAVMIRSNYCYCCESSCDESYERPIDYYNGRYNRISWIFCSNCKFLVDLAEKYYNIRQDSVAYSKTKVIQKKNYKFWRISSNKTINPYLEKEGELNISFGNILQKYVTKNKEKIGAVIGWGEFVKIIPLSNLIYCNPKIFGYFFDEFPIINLSKKWNNLIKKEYNIVQEFNSLKLILNRKYISKDIEYSIYQFWADFN